MKKLIAILGIACSVAAYAQDTTRASSNQTNTIRNVKGFDKTWDHDGIVISNGKVYSRMNGVNTPVEKNLTLKNGSILSNNGTVLLKDGTSQTLTTEQYIDANGNIRLRSDIK